LVYSAKRSEPTITNNPIPAPRIVGQSVPETGREGAVGDAAGAGVAILPGVGVGVPGQLQSVWFGQDGFLQSPTFVLQ
jgi:hypothetical protein